MKTRVVLIVGPPSSGKTTLAKRYPQDYQRLNRDEAGGKVRSLLPKLEAALVKGESVVLDNLFTTVEERKPFVEMAKKHGAEAECMLIKSDIDTCIWNACWRMIQNHGRVLHPEEIKKSKNPNDIPPVVFFKFRKNFEQPSTNEGFDDIVVADGPRWNNGGTKEAVIFDYDSTLRETDGSIVYPRKPEHVHIMQGRKEMLAKLKRAGILLLGMSNQSGIAKGELDDAMARAIFDRTNELLEAKIDYRYCPHKIPPVSCFCRKPQSGAGVQLIHDYNLDPAKCMMVGDKTSDKTFAQRCGFQFEWADKFFAT
jgi:HAD superfamily hydrolase (TIGR01662 family)